MKISDNIGLKKSQIIEILVAFNINLFIFSTNNKLMMYTKYLSLFIIFLCFELFISKRSHKVVVNIYIGLYVTFVAMIFFSCLWVSSSKSILSYSTYFISGICIVSFRFSNVFYRYLLKFFKILFWIFIFSIFLEDRKSVV